MLLSAAVVLLGGILFLIRHAKEPLRQGLFTGEPAEFRNVAGIIKAAASYSSRGIIQLGLLLLIATPVTRVAFSAIAFFRQRDYAYVGFTLIVLAVLVVSFFFGHLWE